MARLELSHKPKLCRKLQNEAKQNFIGASASYLEIVLFNKAKQNVQPFCKHCRQCMFRLSLATRKAAFGVHENINQCLSSSMTR